MQPVTLILAHQGVSLYLYVSDQRVRSGYWHDIAWSTPVGLTVTYLITQRLQDINSQFSNKIWKHSYLHTVKDVDTLDSEMKLGQDDFIWKK